VINVFLRNLSKRDEKNSISANQQYKLTQYRPFSRSRVIQVTKVRSRPRIVTTIQSHVTLPTIVTYDRRVANATRLFDENVTTATRVVSRSTVKVSN
jgi:hypothetical protein